RVELNLTDEEYLSMPPWRFHRLVEAWRRREEREDRRFALIACVLANIHRDPEQDPFELKDFMPRRPKTPEEEREENRAGQMVLNAYLNRLKPSAPNNNAA